MQDYRDIKVWQKARELVARVYRITDSFPERERFGLTSQLRRAVVSVAANIAEGSKRKSNADYARMLNIAEGSLAEVTCLLLLAEDLGFRRVEEVQGSDPFPSDGLEPFMDEIARMLHALRTKVEAER